MGFGRRENLFQPSMVSNTLTASLAAVGRRVTLSQLQHPTFHNMKHRGMSFGEKKKWVTGYHGDSARVTDSDSAMTGLNKFVFLQQSHNKFDLGYSFND